MKRAIVSALLMISLLTACSGGGIVGTWESSGGDYELVFSRDTVVYKSGSSVVEGTYSMTGNRIELVFDNYGEIDRSWATLSDSGDVIRVDNWSTGAFTRK